MSKEPDYKDLVLISTRHKLHRFGPSHSVDEVRLGSELYHRPKPVWKDDSWSSYGGWWSVKAACGKTWSVAIKVELAKQARLKPCLTCYPKKGTKKP